MTNYIHEQKEISYTVWDNGAASNDTRTMRLSYYAREYENEWGYHAVGNDKAALVNIVAYGIGIIKTESGALEEEYIAGVTGDAAAAREIVKLLADNCVTPCGLADVLSDILDE